MISGKPVKPRCKQCKAPDPHVVTRRVDKLIVHDWLCAACEYAREFPDAPKLPLLPRERKPLKLQVETLF